jgi:hypothetical protein
MIAPDAERHGACIASPTMAPGSLSRTLWFASFGAVWASLGTACALDLAGLLDVPDAASVSRDARSGGEGGGNDASRQSSDDVAASADVDTAADVADVVDAGSGETAPSVEAGGACDFSGTWGNRVTINVSWVPQGLTGVILAPGSGQIKQWTLTRRATSGQTTTEIAFVCGIVLPDFSGTQIAGSETYGVRFPDSIFDTGVLPSFTITGSITGSGPTATYGTSPSAALLGLTLPGATTAPWPATIATAVDSDQDGKPGVTAAIAQGGGYSAAPVDGFKTQRADRLYVAIRQVTEISASATDCDHFAGTVTIPLIPDSSVGKYAVDSHVIGCNLAFDGGDCNASQTSFVDTTQPVFSPSGGTSFSSVRLASDATCATVRRELP